jgi:hypothetical protein
VRERWSDVTGIILQSFFGCTGLKKFKRTFNIWPPVLFGLAKKGVKKMRLGMFKELYVCFLDFFKKYEENPQGQTIEGAYRIGNRYFYLIMKKGDNA